MTSDTKSKKAGGGGSVKGPKKKDWILNEFWVQRPRKSGRKLYIRTKSLDTSSDSGINTDGSVISASDGSVISASGGCANRDVNKKSEDRENIRYKVSKQSVISANQRGLFYSISASTVEESKC